MRPTEDIASQVKAPIEGVFSDAVQYWLIRPIEEWLQDSNRDWTCIGGPGVDGIEFGVLDGSEGVHAYFPIEGEYRRLAGDVPTLIDEWEAGRIVV
ncbi:hypothetical protein ACFQY0_21045 [Haloferula chungangensis]|uniref:SMI1/KNR4 family protein n=1 Tax=Haloferula chungangensis TaxID=1048331 RepID=A0ABW2LDK0_9BACT